jgi:hypothetical protein
MDTKRFPFSGRSFEVDYGNLTATNLYGADGSSLAYEITTGALKGSAATVGFEWQHLHEETYVISWQEADGSTVVHVDDFKAGRSLSFFTTTDGQFFRLEGTLTLISSDH